MRQLNSAASSAVTGAGVGRLAIDALRLQVDLGWGLVEIATLPAVWPTLTTMLPDGAGRGVLAIPAYLAGDRSMAVLIHTLRTANFDAITWGLGRNRAGGSERLLTAFQRAAVELRPAVDDLVQRTGGPIALVGQSLGGAYARWLAERFGESIDRVITLGGASFTGRNDRYENKALAKISEALSGRTVAQRIANSTFAHWGLDGPRIPLVSIYSPVDGVVGPGIAAIPASQLSSTPPIRENIRILGSHTGMASQAGTMLAVADRLAEPVADWRPFDPSRRLLPALQYLGPLLFPSGCRDEPATV